MVLSVTARVNDTTVPLANGLTLPVVRMTKQL